MTIRKIVIIITVFGILCAFAAYADTHISSSKHGPSHTITVNNTAFTHTTTCSQQVKTAARKHHVSKKAQHQVDGSRCYRSHTAGKPHTITLSTKKLRSMNAPRALVRQSKCTPTACDAGPIKATTTWNEWCGITCLLWHAKLKVEFLHNRTGVWVNGKQYKRWVYIDCSDYGGLTVDFTVQNCGWIEQTAFVDSATPYITASEGFEIKSTVLWITYSKHYAMTIDCYTNGKTEYGD